MRYSVIIPGFIESLDGSCNYFEPFEMYITLNDFRDHLDLLKRFFVEKHPNAPVDLSNPFFSNPNCSGLLLREFLKENDKDFRFKVWREIREDELPKSPPDKETENFKIWLIKNDEK